MRRRSHGKHSIGLHSKPHKTSNRRFGKRARPHRGNQPGISRGGIRF